MRHLLSITLLSLAFGMNASAASDDQVIIPHIKTEFDIHSLDAPEWQRVPELAIGRYWSGESAPASRSVTAKLLWSPTALYVRFNARQHEPLIIGNTPDLTQKTRGLWDRDVCEIFIAPDAKRPNAYYEFEVAPTGEWIDLAIEFTPARRVTNWDYHSGLTSAAAIEKDRVTMAIKIPFRALGKAPKAGDIWLGNLFRCIGKDPNRGYLAWRPTRTKEPAFHVPSAFGKFQFVK